MKNNMIFKVRYNIIGKIIVISLFICLYFSYELYSQFQAAFLMNDIFTPMGSPVEIYINTEHP